MISFYLVFLFYYQNFLGGIPIHSGTATTETKNNIFFLLSRTHLDWTDGMLVI